MATYSSSVICIDHCGLYPMSRRDHRSVKSQVSKGLTPNELGTKLTSTDLTLGPDLSDRLSCSLSWSPVQTNGKSPCALCFLGPLWEGSSRRISEIGSESADPSEWSLPKLDESFSGFPSYVAKVQKVARGPQLFFFLFSSEYLAMFRDILNYWNCKVVFLICSG